MNECKEIDVLNNCSKISQLIHHLENLQAEFGDLDISVDTQDGGLYDIHRFEVYKDCVIIS